MCRQVDRGDGLSAAVKNRHRKRAQAALQLFVDDRECLVVVGAYAIEQCLQVGDGLRSVGLDALRLQPPPDLSFIEIAEQDSSERSVQGGEPAADRQRADIMRRAGTRAT